jgi:hypothetical protein
MHPELRFDHLAALTTPIGLFEHALGTTPRMEHAYCVDDVARGLVVTARIPNPSPEVVAMRNGYLAFILASIRADGLVTNRRRTDGSWRGKPTSDDHWGRALWSLGVASVHVEDALVAGRARSAAAIALRARSHWPRSMAYASLGAGLLLDSNPDDVAALRLLVDARRVLPHHSHDREWPWPEKRLTYANPVLPEAMLVIGGALEDDALVTEGLALLEWLVDQQIADGHLSVIPSTGRSRKDRHRGYAQQPIEVAALAEACRTAYTSTLDSRWLGVIELSMAWFAGDNDGGVPMCDPVTGGGFDGLERDGASSNQGAESTLAWLSTAQVAVMPQLAVTP